MSHRLLCSLGTLLILALVPAATSGLFLSGNALAKDIRVPGDYGKIQAAIDAAGSDDTVLVAAGTYPENIDFKGKDITLRSREGRERTVIDGGKAGTVVTFRSGESSGAVLQGFKIKHGLPRESFGFGGGVYIRNASPVIRECWITENGAHNGGGIFVEGGESAPRIEDNLISANIATAMGGGIVARNGCAPKILNNEITENVSMNGGAVFVSDGASPEIGGNTVSNNNSGCCMRYPEHAENYLKGIDVTAGIGCGDKLPGAVFIADHSSPFVHDNTVEANIGGGLGVFLNSAPLIKNNIIKGNYGSRLLAGGIMLAFDAGPILSGNTIRDNQPGAIWIDETSSILDEEKRPVSLAGYHIIEDTNEAFSFSEGWSLDIAEYNSGGTRRISCPDAEYPATVRFKGSAVSLIYGAWNNNGKAAVKIDGVAYDPVDMYIDGDRRLGMTEKMIATGLSPSREHVLEISLTGEKNPLSSGYCISVDAVGVLAGTELGSNLVSGSVRRWPPAAADGSKTAAGSGSTRRVPGEHATIQAAIDAAGDGDTIIVAPGTYRENIDFMGKRLALKSSNPADGEIVKTTVLEAEKAGPATVVFARGEGRGTKLEGFTIRNPGGGKGIFIGSASPVIKGNVIKDCPEGGIACYYSEAPLITQNTVVNNAAASGSGIWCYLSVPQIRGNKVRDNSGPGIGSYFGWPVIVGNTISGNTGGAGIWLDHLSIATIKNNRIFGNKGMYGGIYLDFFCNSTIEGNLITDNDSRGLFMILDCSPVITNNVIAKNRTGLTVSLSRPKLMNNTIADNSNTGIYMADVARAVVTNTILWNAYGEFYMPESASVQVTHSLVEDGWTGKGNLSREPLFVGGGDYHLKRTSPCIDAGTAEGAPAVDADGYRRPLGAGYDIGAYEWGDTPAPDVKVNGSDTALTVSKYDAVDVTISLDCRARAGTDADWWVGVLTSFGAPYNLLTMTGAGGWKTGLHPFREQPLADLAAREILNLPLPAGNYYFIFGLDDATDDVFELSWWDMVQVRVE